MAKRSIEKVRHIKQAPSFAERVAAGVKRETRQLWEKYGWNWDEKNARPVIQSKPVQFTFDPPISLRSGWEATHAEMPGSFLAAVKLQREGVVKHLPIDIAKGMAIDMPEGVSVDRDEVQGIAKAIGALMAKPHEHVHGEHCNH